MPGIAIMMLMTLLAMMMFMVMCMIVVMLMVMMIDEQFLAMVIAQLLETASVCALFLRTAPNANAIQCNTANANSYTRPKLHHQRE